MPLGLAGVDHVILIEVGPVQLILRSSGALGTEDMEKIYLHNDTHYHAVVIQRACLQGLYHNNINM